MQIPEPCMVDLTYTGSGAQASAFDKYPSMNVTHRNVRTATFRRQKGSACAGHLAPFFPVPLPGCPCQPLFVRELSLEGQAN